MEAAKEVAEKTAREGTRKTVQYREIKHLNLKGYAAKVK
jgi:hypothetical protein